MDTLEEILSASDEDILLDEIDRLKSESNNLKSFADSILQCAFEGSSLDGADIQDIGTQTGVLKETQMTEFCGDVNDCSCREFCDEPSTCYRKTYK